MRDQGSRPGDSERAGSSGCSEKRLRWRGHRERLSNVSCILDCEGTGIAEQG